MTKLCVGRLGWLAGVVVLAVLLLLAARVDVLTSTVRDSSVSGRLTALVSCVLPAPADNPPLTPASVSATIAPDCETSTPDHLRTAWMTPC